MSTQVPNQQPPHFLSLSLSLSLFLMHTHMHTHARSSKCTLTPSYLGHHLPPLSPLADSTCSPCSSCCLNPDSTPAWQRCRSFSTTTSKNLVSLAHRFPSTHQIHFCGLTCLSDWHASHLPLVGQSPLQTSRSYSRSANVPRTLWAGRRILYSDALWEFLLRPETS